jgi:PAS domain S-box-containing protein
VSDLDNTKTLLNTVRDQKDSEKRNLIPIHWIIFLNILISSIIILIGGIKISQDIRFASDQSRSNLIQSAKTSKDTGQLILQQLPLRKIVAREKFLVARFAYEFELFVAREEGNIRPLKTAWKEMLSNYKTIESVWIEKLPKDNLITLKANINMATGIFEEASEFKTVGFGELYRLAEDSKSAVNKLISVMDQIDLHLDQTNEKAALAVFRGSAATYENEKSMSAMLQSIGQQNLLTLGIILSTIIFSQIVFFLFFKKRLSHFTKMTKFISKKGDFSRRIALNSKDEFGLLAQSFNGMLENLQKTTTSEVFLSNIIESMNDMVLVVSSAGIILTGNASAYKITGLKKEDLAGNSLFSFFTESQDDIVKIILKRLKIINLEKIITLKKDKKIPVLFSASPLIQSGGTENEEKIICVLHDITDRVKMEREKIEAQKIISDQAKYALIGQVAGKMAHDFNNVLGIIMGNAEMALIDCQDKNLKQTLELIFEQTIRGKNLTMNLIAFAKSQDPKYEFFKINEKIELVINLLKKDLFKVQLVIEDDTGEMELLADPGMIEHALVNLIQNSIHATSKEDLPIIIIRTYCDDNFVCLEIEDNGCGIPEEYQQCLYDPSFSLKGSKDTTGSYMKNIKGTGYGMANVKKYVEQHKGEILLESKFGSGTVFTIRLPVVQKELSTEEKAELQESTLQVEKSILLVEDEESISDVQYRILTQDPLNHRVDVANSGQKGLDLYHRNTYDFISLDYVLPGDITGIDIYNSIRKADKKIPILFISGNIEFIESIKELQKTDQFVDHLSKPCQNKDYINRINKLLNKTIPG